MMDSPKSNMDLIRPIARSAADEYVTPPVSNATSRHQKSETLKLSHDELFNHLYDELSAPTPTPDMSKDQAKLIYHDASLAAMYNEMKLSRSN